MRAFGQKTKICQNAEENERTCRGGSSGVENREKDAQRKTQDEEEERKTEGRDEEEHFQEKSR